MSTLATPLATIKHAGEWCLGNWVTKALENQPKFSDIDIFVLLFHSFSPRVLKTNIFVTHSGIYIKHYLNKFRFSYKMNNQHKFLIGIAVTYFVVVSLVALKLSRSGTGGDDEEEDIESEEEKKVE